jgi:hypothetical protein
MLGFPRLGFETTLSWHTGTRCLVSGHAVPDDLSCRSQLLETITTLASDGVGMVFPSHDVWQRS